MVFKDRTWQMRTRKRKRPAGEMVIIAKVGNLWCSPARVSDEILQKLWKLLKDIKMGEKESWEGPLQYKQISGNLTYKGG